jgi:hypothetical protein
VKVLFSAVHCGYYRNFESVVQALAARGHQVHLLADEPETFGGQALVERLAEEHPGVTWGAMPLATDEPWFPFAQKLRYALDYVRFLEPRYADVPKLRLRNIDRTPRIVRWLTSGVGEALVGHRAVARLIRWFESSMPRSSAVRAYLESQAPDAVVLTSLTFSRSSAIEQLKAARGLGIPVGAAIMSWDHLSSKALLQIAPDMTLVWNEVQQREAVDMHGLPASSVVVTGAQCFDQWFDRPPSRPREEFCRQTGLDPSRPFLLYVCSAMSPVPTPLEPQFVKQWVGALRASNDPALRDIGVLVRPHPERLKEWADVSLDGIDNVALRGGTPIDGDSRADYFDALAYSRAVVGLCTSAFLEAAIAGRPVLTLLLPAYRMHQDGMAHFRYLLTVAGGLLHTAPDIDAHLTQLAGVLRAPEGRDQRNRRFLTAFVRPHGLETPATPLFADAVERLGGMPRRVDPRFAAERPTGRLVGRLAAMTRHGIGHWLMMDATDSVRAAGERERVVVKHQRQVVRTAYVNRKAETREAQSRERQQEQRAKARIKWRRGLSARKQMARLKGGLKQLAGFRHQ